MTSLLEFVTLVLAFLLTIATALPSGLVNNATSFQTHQNFARDIKPRCERVGNPNKCWFGSAWWFNQPFAHYSVFRNTCEQIGYNPHVRVGKGIGHFAMNSQLRYVLDVTMIDYTLPPKVWYAGREYGLWNNDLGSRTCYNDNSMSRGGLYCMTSFDC